MGRITHPGEANFVAQAVEATDAHLRVADIVKLGEAEAAVCVSEERSVGTGLDYPLQAPVEVSMIALEVSTAPKREANLNRRSSSVVG